MKVFQLGVLFFICLGTSYGQSVTKRYCCIEVAITKEKKKIATIENKLGYICADSSWLQSVEKQVNESLQPLKNIKKGKYLVSVQYILDKESNISDIRPLTSNGYGLEEAVIRVLKKGQKWIPAIQNGRTVRPYRKSTITNQDN